MSKGSPMIAQQSMEEQADALEIQQIEQTIRFEQQSMLSPNQSVSAKQSQQNIVAEQSKLKNVDFVKIKNLNKSIILGIITLVILLIKLQLIEVLRRH